MHNEGRREVQHRHNWEGGSANAHLLKNFFFLATAEGQIQNINIF